jgi:hypothetical protein
MKLSEHKDLKASIINLPPKEKDKLLLRLIAKDKVLTEHLHFKLLEDELDLEDRKNRIKSDIDDSIPEIKKLNAKDALARFRKIITGINHFYKVTKSTVDEVELKIYALSVIPTSFRGKIFGYRDFGFLFENFYLKTLNVTLNKFHKLHEDLQFDMSVQVNEVLIKVHNSNLSNLAEEYKLPKKLDY